MRLIMLIRLGIALYMNIKKLNADQIEYEMLPQYVIISHKYALWYHASPQGQWLLPALSRWAPLCPRRVGSHSTKVLLP